MFIDFRKREKGRERKNINMRNIYWLPLKCTLTKDPTHNLGTCPDLELNPQPCGIWNNVLTN